MSAENTTNTGAQEAENAEKYAVEVKNVTKIYRLYDKPIDRLKESLSVSHKEYHKDFYALSDLSFTVEKGQTVGIIGTNGSGKSTILKIITGVLTPTTGEVTVRGKISALLELGAGFNQDYTGIENIYMNGTMIGYTKRDGCKAAGDSRFCRDWRFRLSAGQDVLERYVRASGICACDQRRAGDPDR